MTRRALFPPSFVPWALCLGIAAQAAYVDPDLPAWPDRSSAARGLPAPRTLPPLQLDRTRFESPSDRELVASRGLRVAHGPEGYRLARVPAHSLLDELGFETGDLVTSIADVPLDSADVMLEVGRRALESPAFMVEFERRGERWARRFAWK